MPKRPTARPLPATGPISNRLLAALPREDYDRLLAGSKIVPLKLKQVLHRRGQPLRQVYFPNGGVVCSFTTVMTDGSMVEVATVGDEGMIGIRAFWGGERALSETFVQTGESTAVQVPIEVFRGEIERHGALDE